MNGGRGHAILLTIASWAPSEIMTGFPRIFETKCLSPKRLCRAGQRVVSRGAVAERTLRTSFCLKMALIGKTGIDAVRSRFAWKYNRSTVSGTNTGKGGKRAAKTKQFFFFVIRCSLMTKTLSLHTCTLKCHPFGSYDAIKSPLKV